MIHDVAIAIRRLQKDGKIRRAMTVDCDVHQGNGTAAIFAGAVEFSVPLPSFGPVMQVLQENPAGESPASTPAADVFTISLHQQNNYPEWKPPSSIDVNLPDGIGDEQYLAWLDNALSSGLRQFAPDLICYLAGADPYREDQLGGLGLTLEGLKQRDHLVFRVARARGIPVMVTYAGGYARRVEDTVTIHANTVVAAREIFAGCRRRPVPDMSFRASATGGSSPEAGDARGSSVSRNPYSDIAVANRDSSTRPRIAPLPRARSE